MTEPVAPKPRKRPPLVKRTEAEPIDKPVTDPRFLKATIEAHGRMKERRVRVQAVVKQTGTNSYVHEAGAGFMEEMFNVQLGDALGTTSNDFKDRTLSQIATVLAGKTERKAEQDLNVALAVLDGAKPENEIEAMLVAQMVVTNDAAMSCIAQIGKGLGHQTEVYGNLGVKLLRTYTAQVEALAKLRRKGEQTVKVVHVYPGGQAVVGDVHNHPAGGGVISESEYQPDGTEAVAIGPALLGQDPQSDGMPISGHAERAVQAPRRAKPRRAPRQPERV